MNHRVEKNVEVHVEKWSTPITHSSDIQYLSQMRFSTEYCFFFESSSPDSSSIHVLTVPSLSPFRTTKDMFAKSHIGKYLKGLDLKENGSVQTYKLWNTSFIEEIEENNALSGYTLGERNKSIFQCLIICQNDWIEFLPLREVIWSKYDNVLLEDLMIKLLKDKW